MLSEWELGELRGWIFCEKFGVMGMGMRGKKSFDGIDFGVEGDSPSIYVSLDKI